MNLALCVKVEQFCQAVVQMLMRKIPILIAKYTLFYCTKYMSFSREICDIT